MRIDRFIRSLSGNMLACGRYRMAQTYNSVLHRLETCSNHRFPTLDVVFSRGFLFDFYNRLLLDGLSRNTVSYYLSGLRSVYASAIREGKLRMDPDLFANVSCSSVPTVKRAVSVETIALLHAADLSDVPRLERCRDWFMLSFHLQGMPFVDLAHLRKSDIQGNSIAYRRLKTRGVVQVSISEPVQAIIDKYAVEVADGSPYVLPLVSLPGIDGCRQYQSALRRHNRQLKDLAAHLNIEGNLTSYVARHSWATLAYHSGVEVGVVSQGMGHHTEEITRIYLSSFDQKRLSDANRIVLQAILRPIRDGYISNVREEVRQEIVREFGVGIAQTDAPVLPTSSETVMLDSVTAQIDDTLVQTDDVAVVNNIAATVANASLDAPFDGCGRIGYGRGRIGKKNCRSETKNVCLCSKDGQ